MADAPPGVPGHSSGTALLRVHNPDGDDGLYELICPACGDSPDIPYASASEQHKGLRGPWSLDVARAKRDYHIGANTLAVQLGLHLTN